MAKKWKTKQYTGTVEGALEGAKSEIESLRDEMSEWRDNMEENLSHTEKYEEVSQCADELESMYDNLDSVELPEGLGDATCSYSEASPYGRKAAPRWMRLSNAQDMLVAVRTALEEKRDEQAAMKDDETEEDFDGTDQVEGDEFDFDTNIGYIEEAEGAAEGISFPGMY